MHSRTRTTGSSPCVVLLLALHRVAVRPPAGAPIVAHRLLRLSCVASVVFLLFHETATFMSIKLVIRNPLTFQGHREGVVLPQCHSRLLLQRRLSSLPRPGHQFRSHACPVQAHLSSSSTGFPAARLIRPPCTPRSYPRPRRSTGCLLDSRC